MKKNFSEKYSDLTDNQKHLISEIRGNHNFKIVKEGNNYILYYKQNLVRVLNAPTVDKLVKLHLLSKNNNVFKLIID